MSTCAQYIAAAKSAKGDPRMTDQALGHEVGFAQQTIWKAKNGQMSDAVALAIGKLLKEHGLVDHEAEVILVAHAERDSDPKVRKALMDYAKKVVGRASQKATAAIVGAAVMLGLMWPLPDARMAVGGEGGIRTHGTLRYA